MTQNKSVQDNLGAPSASSTRCAAVAEVLAMMSEGVFGEELQNARSVVVPGESRRGSESVGPLVASTGSCSIQKLPGSKYVVHNNDDLPGGLKRGTGVTYKITYARDRMPSEKAQVTALGQKTGLTQGRAA